MLVLKRKRGEAISIGDGVRVVVLGIVEGQVKLGIEAPGDVAVDREEIRARSDYDGERRRSRQ